MRPYAADEPLAPGDVLLLEGRYWLVDRIEGSRALARPARYRLMLRHPEGHEELGAFRRFRPDAPRIGHEFSTIADGTPVTWQVVDERLDHDEQDEPYLLLLAERDFDEVEELPDHELEHAFDRRAEDEIPEQAAAMFARAEREGLSMELAVLEPGEEPDWAEAERYIDALILDEIEDDLLEQCGVSPRTDARETWLGTVQERLRDDVSLLRADLEGDHDDVEEWSFRGGRIVASVGTTADESDPNNGHGWLSRLVDSGALAAAGFVRVKKARLDVLEP